MASDSFLYGLKRFQFWKVDSNGYHAGTVTNPDSVSVAGGIVGSGALVIDNPVLVPSVDLTRAIITEKGGNEVKQKIDAGIEDFSEFDIQMTRINSLLNQAASGVGQNTALQSGVKIGGMDAIPKTLKKLGFMYTTRDSEKTSSGYNQTKYAQFSYNSGTLAHKPGEANQNTGENPQLQNYTWSPAKINKAFNGQLLSAISGLDYPDGETLFLPYFDMDSEMYFWGAWLPTAAADVTITLPYLPLSSSVALAGANLITLNGVPSATIVASINTTTGLVTVAASGYSAGDRLHIAYPTNFVPSA
jgi:hypothetical protein